MDWFKILNKSDDYKLQHFQSTPPVSSNMNVVASPSFSELDNESTQYVQSFQQKKFLNVLKTLDNQFNFRENQIFKPN